MTPQQPSGMVGVVMAARNAQATIARAVRSALADPVVAEVLVVDDASTDQTAEAVRAADDGSRRLKLLRLDRNQGPSAARNLAIAAASTPYLTVLDADDYWLAGRMTKLVNQIGDADFVADDLLCVVEGREQDPPRRLLDDEMSLPCALSLGAFVLANISRPGHDRRELGFLKPLIRRSFLQEHDLAYDETVRQGEDFLLYAQALARGAKFRLVEACGYVAVQRAGSLSGAHGAADLAALLKACGALAREPGLSGSERRALAAHRRHLSSKLHHRRVLDIRRQAGLARALGAMAADPRGMIYVLKQSIRAKIELYRGINLQSTRAG